MVAKIYDTLLGEYIKNPGIRGLSLDKLSQKDFGYRMISFNEVTNKKKLNFKDVDLKEAAIYSGEDVYITNKLFLKQEEEKITDNKILNDIEMPLIKVLQKMEIDGVFVDPDRLKGIGTLLENEIRDLEKNILDEVGEDFNIKSPKQVGVILFDKLGLPRGKKNKTGYSVNAEVLGELAHNYPIAQKIIDYRHFTKILSTYVEGILELIDEDSLIHTSYNTAVTSTGRLSSTAPNLQNIPSSNGIAGEVRDAFISRFDGGKILAFDYSQVEIRILAIMSGDENLINTFRDGIDIHHRTAEFLFPDSTITNNERKIAKGVNFGVIYGISGFGLAKMIGISMKDAKIYIGKFYESYPKVKTFLEKIIKGCEENKYVETLFGRKRYINGINDLNKMIKSSAEREAINMPIQGTSADVIKIAMLEVFNFLENKRLKSKMIMQVHDELVFDVFPGEEDILKKEIVIIMQNILIDKPIILKTDIGEGGSWKETK
ncbi:MAG: DNA polymerase [Candidatus Gracilibacteria bacterium]